MEGAPDSRQTPRRHVEAPDAGETVSHRDAHNWTGWTLETVRNAAGEQQTLFVRYCTMPRCGAVDKEPGAISETPPGYHYAKYLAAGSEPDD